MQDLRLRKPALSKTQYKRRIQEVLRTARAQKAPKLQNLKKVCKEVLKKKGAMSRQ